MSFTSAEWQEALARMASARSAPTYMPAALLVALDMLEDGPAAEIRFEPLDERFRALMQAVDPAGADRAWEPFYHLSTSASIWTLRLGSDEASFPSGRPKGRSGLVKRADRARFVPELAAALADEDGREAVRQEIYALLERDGGPSTKLAEVHQGRRDVLGAIAEFDRLGRDSFLERYGFRRARRYFLVHDGEQYDSKAIWGVAVGLGPADFSGGQEHAVRALRELGFEVEGPAESAEPQAPKGRRAWIFQGNPDAFDVDGYLAAGLPRITWTVRQHAQEIEPGDTVYLWRAGGKSRARAGIVAEAVVDSEPWDGPDHQEAAPYWRAGDSTQSETRVWLRVRRVASTREVIKRGWLKDDPVCGDLLILRQAAGTNFAVSPHHAERLRRLWRRTGRDWSRAESIAALRVYHQLYGSPISKAADSPVAALALLVGRAVGGAYNKVLNFRSLDPRDERAGLPAVGQTDRDVWAEFFDATTQAVRADALGAEYARLWGAGEAELEDAAEALEAAGEFDPTSIEDGRERVLAAIVRRQGQPAFRKALMAAYGGRCAITGCDAPEALEAAHIVPYMGEATNTVQNGLLLRADLHTLFDRGLMGVDPKLLTVVITHGLRGTCYEELEGKDLELPEDEQQWPSEEALLQRRLNAIPCWAPAGAPFVLAPPDKNDRISTR